MINDIRHHEMRKELHRSKLEERESKYRAEQKSILIARQKVIDENSAEYDELPNLWKEITKSSYINAQLRIMTLPQLRKKEVLELNE